MPSDLEPPLKPGTTPEASRQEYLSVLAKVISSDAFGRAERPARFLRHLVETTLRGDSHLLKETVLGCEVFGREATWDPRLDPIVRQEAARLRKRLAKYYENGGSQDPLRIDLPVGTYVPVFRPNLPGPPPSAALPLEVQTVPAKRRSLGLYISAGLFVIAAALFWRAFSRSDPSPSIAVLPFANLTPDPANQYFSEGLTDEITDALARLKTLRVIAPSSASRFEGKSVNVREVGRLLHVANIVEGSVERSGDRIRIVAHLERASDGLLLWSNTYERNASDLFAIQAELASGIASGLNLAAGAPATQHVPAAEAHDFVMKGRYDLQQLTTESTTRAESEFQHAIDLDPAYAAGYLGLATAKYNQYAARGSTYQSDAERKTAQSLYRRALALDPGLPSAHAMLAALAMQYDWDWRYAERELQAASSGPPSASAEGYYAFFLIFHGRFAEADPHLARMMELDPFSSATQGNLSLAWFLEGRFQQAREISQKAAEERPLTLAPQQMITLAYIAEGHPELALPLIRQLELRFPLAQVVEAMAHAKAGRREEALRLIRPYEEKYPNSGIPMQWFALVYAFLGDEPNTVKWLNRSADAHEWQVLNLAVHPVYRPMQDSPGFRALKRRIGL